jgi:hypothetical protein
MIINTPMIITFTIYLFAMMAIGWIGYRATDNLSDYILGGRSLGSFVTALSAGASDMSGWLLMGLPGAVFLNGISEAWIAVVFIRDPNAKQLIEIRWYENGVKHFSVNTNIKHPIEGVPTCAMPYYPFVTNALF